MRSLEATIKNCVSSHRGSVPMCRAWAWLRRAELGREASRSTPGPSLHSMAGLPPGTEGCRHEPGGLSAAGSAAPGGGPFSGSGVVWTGLSGPCTSRQQQTLLATWQAQLAPSPLALLLLSVGQGPWGLSSETCRELNQAPNTPCGPQGPVSSGQRDPQLGPQPGLHSSLEQERTLLQLTCLKAFLIRRTCSGPAHVRFWAQHPFMSLRRTLGGR